MKRNLSLICTILCVILFPFNAFGQLLETEIIKRDTLTEASISAERIIAKPTYKIQSKEIRGTISAMGEPDAIKYIQTLPGVASGIEGTSSFYVRGGNMGNNLITLDGVTIFGSSHLMGFASIFPSSIIDRTDFFVGGFTSEDGNLLSSHVKMTSKSGDFHKFHTQLSLSNIMASAMFSTPIVREKLSFIVSGRWSPAAFEYNAIAKKIDPSLGLPSKIGASVYDVYAKLDYHPGKNHSLALSVFNSADSYSFSVLNDVEYVKSADTLDWNNMIGLLSWDWNIGEAWALRTKMSYNKFYSEQLQGRRLNMGDITYIALRSMINEAKVSMLVQYSSIIGLNIQFGADARYSEFNPGAYTSVDTRNIDNRSANWLVSANAQISYDKNGEYHLRAALRGNWFKNEEYIKLLPEVRIYVDYFFSKHIGMEFTADYLNQYYHTLEGIPTGVSSDMIVPSGAYADPERAGQLYLGMFSKFGNGFRISAGGFYKQMFGLVFFSKASDFFTSSASKWKENLDIGKGSSYGAEFLAQREGELFSAKIAYTYSKTDRTFPSINNGQPIPFKFDRTHVLNASASYLFGKSSKLEHGMNASFTLSSGHHETLQSGSYPGYMLPFEDIPENNFFDDMVFYTHPNNYRMPLYIRLDISYDIKIKRQTCSHNITLGIFNVLNRHNAYSLYWDSDALNGKSLAFFRLCQALTIRLNFERV